MDASKFDIIKQKLQNKITYFEIDEAFQTLELVEDYPDDSRGSSCLALGFTYEGKPLHFVVGNLEEEKVLIITMYKPKAEEWIDFKVRR